MSATAKAASQPNMKRWTDAKLDKELAFAIAAEDRDCPDNVAWLTKLKIEAVRRQAMALPLGEFAQKVIAATPA